MGKDDLARTKQLMGALARQPPKPHDEMKLGKKEEAPAKGKRAASAKPESAKRSVSDS